MLSRLATLCRAPTVRVTLTQNILPKGQIYRCFSQENRSTLSRAARRQTLKEKLAAPPSENAYSLGKGALVGASAVGLGALCYYGLGLSNQAGIVDNAMLWTDLVKERIHTVYMYFGGSLALSAASAVMVFQTPALLQLVTRGGFLSIMAIFAAMMGTGALAQSIEYSPGFGTKQMAWMLHTAVMGAVLAPLCILGGPTLMRALWMTGGVVGGLSTIAVCAPSEQFLNMGAPLAMGLGLVFASSLAGMFLPPTTALGAGLYSISMYGGLILFSGFLLYDTQRIVKQAELYPTYALRPYDPINAAMSIYMDTLNIFMRIAMILSGSGGNQKRK